MSQLKKSELGITGIVMLPDVRAELESLIDTNEIEVFQMQTRSADFIHAIQLTFSDFNAITFARDYVISVVVQKAMSGAYDKFKAVVQRYTNKREVVKSVCIEKSFVSEDGIHYTIYVVADAERFEHLLQQLGAISQEKLLPQSENDTVVIKLNDDGEVETKII